MINKETKQKIVGKMAANWVNDYKHDGYALHDIAISGLIGYDEYSDEDLLREFYESYVEGQDESGEDYKLWAEATAQVETVKLVIEK